MRLRLPQIARLARTLAPDILCLQETKVRDQDFPGEAFARLGYESQAILGQSGYNGVAILSRLPLAPLAQKVWRGRDDKRYLAVRLEGQSPLEVHCFYVPSGGGHPDRAQNPKLDDKFRFVEAMTRWSRKLDAAPRLLVGDFNIAHLETDVWNHKGAQRSVGHTPAECAAFRRFLAAGGWHDLHRELLAPPAEPLFTWWSYRHPQAWREGKGWRLDYALASPSLRPRVASAEVFARARGWKAPSDHAPLMVDLAA